MITARVKCTSLLGALLALGLSGVELLAASGSITIASPVTNRLIQVVVQAPTNAYWVKLSEAADFHEGTNGISIRIGNVASNLDSMDLDITYPGGVPGGRGQPAALPSGQKELRVLVIPTRMQDGGAVPSYATFEWMNRLMFSTTAGPDARTVPNSVKKWFEQNSYGHVTVSGEVYPGWVTVNSSRYYNDLTNSISERIILDATAKIKETNPAFFDGEKFTLVILFLPGDLSATFGAYDFSTSIWNDPNGYFQGYYLMDLALEPNSIYRSSVTNEPNTALDPVHVKTRYTTESVTGVWLASDPAHSGTNFFTGGSSYRWHNTITLGTALPETNAAVLVTYTPPAWYKVLRPMDPLFSQGYGDLWYGAFIHEFAHSLGVHISFTDVQFITDLYQVPAELISYYGAMSDGNHCLALWENTGVRFNEPCHFEAYTKYSLGLLLPYEVRYGENETGLRLFAAEEYPYTSRCKMIKVPVKPPGQFSFLRFNNKDYMGDEYLLLELRRKGSVPGIHNFDRGLLHEGLLIYHVLEGYPNGHGYEYCNLVRILDATPWKTNPAPGDTPLDLERLSMVLTPAPFGPASGCYQFCYSDPWQCMAADGGVFKFHVQGTGTPRIYAKIADKWTNELFTTFADVQFAWTDANTNGLPDNWEMTYFGALNTERGAPNVDADGDGMGNLQEYLAGTNPTNTSSGLWIKSQVSNNWLYVSFPKKANHRYYFESSHSLTRPRWSAVNQSYLWALSYDYTNSFSFSLTSQVPASFYRLRLVP